MAFSITTSCKEKEKAFEFLKMFWTYDYQKKWSVMSFPFPTRKDVLEKKLEYASASKSYIDEDGQKVTAVSGTTSFNGIEVKKKPLKGILEPVSHREILRFDTFIISASCCCVSPFSFLSSFKNSPIFF